jgi:membrane-associated phospholipid phosphatase
MIPKLVATAFHSSALLLALGASAQAAAPSMSASPNSTAIPDPNAAPTTIPDPNAIPNAAPTTIPDPNAAPTAAARPRLRMRLDPSQVTPRGSRRVYRKGPETALRYNVPVDLGITVAALALTATLELGAASLAPSSCRWCDRNPDGTSALNGFDSGIRRSLRWSNRQSADMASNVFSFALAPLAGVGLGAFITWHDGRLDEFPADLLVVTEAAALALSLNSLSKYALARERPDVHAMSEDERFDARSSGDNLSFFSGHTTLAFALATSAGTVASMRKHRLAPVMWVAGLLLAGTSGYLRIAADRHYASDVLTGAVMGSAIGIGVPYFAHRPMPERLRLGLLPVKSGSGLVLRGNF